MNAVGVITGQTSSFNADFVDLGKVCIENNIDFLYAKNINDPVYAATKIFRHPYVKCIVTMEIPSETDFGKPMHPFTPNMYIDITNYLDKKIEAMKIYRTEIGEHPFPRSLKNIEAHGIMHGASAGVMYAEAFRVVKIIS